MQDLLLKCVRWYFVIAFVIAGIGLLNLADRHDSIKPVLPGLICLGTAFISGTAWKDLRRRVLFITIVMVTGFAWSAQFIPEALYVVLGRPVAINYFVGWSALTFFAGFPAMMYVYHKYGD